MRGFADKTSSLHEDGFEELRRQTAHTIAERSRQLDAMKLETTRAKEATAECNNELQQRVALMVEMGPVGDALLQFGKLVKQESHLAGMSNAPPAANGKGRTIDPSNTAQHMEDCAIQKAESLHAQILEVKQALEDVRARSLAAKTILDAPADKPKRKKQARK